VHEDGSGLLLLSRNIEDVSQILGGGQDCVSQIYVQHEQKTRTASTPLRFAPDSLGGSWRRPGTSDYASDPAPQSRVWSWISAPR